MGLEIRRRVHPIRLAVGLSLALLPVWIPAPALAQGADWAWETELGASVFFGNRSQTTVTSRVAVERADSAYEMASDVAFSYGESTDEGGGSFVHKRAWLGGMNLQYGPNSRLSPFLTARVESNLEKKVDLRYEAGLGGRVVVLRSPVSRVDLSVSVLAERTFPLGSSSSLEGSTLARWSARVRFRRTLGEGRLILSGQSWYQPVFDAFDNFTVRSETSLAFRLSEVVSLKLSFHDNYDSGAADRGARTNNDGQLFFSVLGAF